MSLDRLISRELRRNPPDVEERVNVMGAELVDWLDENYKTVGVTPELRGMFERYSFEIYKNTGQTTPHEPT